MIITGMLCRISDGDVVRRYLLTTDPYHDPTLAGQIEYGTALPVIPSGAGLSWGEEIFFQPQGGSNNINVSDVPIINDGRFDDWGGWAFAGLDQILGRGEHDRPFSEWQQFHFVGRGKPEFQGRRIIIGLRDRFAYMREPVAQQVFPDTVANDRLINTTVPMVFGAAYQVRPLLTDPQILKYAVGTNVNDVPQVQEGGNPSTPVFVFVPNGFQLFQSPSLQITCNVSGPPLPEWEEADALINIGQFNDWTDDKPDGWIVTEDAPWSVISETIDGDARVESTAQIDGDTGWVGANLWESGVTAAGPSWAPVPGTDSLTDVLQDDDGTYANHSGLDYNVHWLIGTGFDFGLTEDVAPVELDVRLTLQNMSGGQPIVRALYVRFPDGTVRNLLPGGVNFVPSPKDTWEFTIQNPPSGIYRLTNDILQDPEFQLWVEVVRSSSTPAGSQTVRIYEASLRCHFGPIIDRLRLTTEDDVLTTGNRYLMRIRTLGDSSDSIRAYWGGADNEFQSLTEIDDPFAQTTSVFEGEEEAEFSFVANGPRFAIEFDRGEGNGEQTIEQIEVIDQSASRERYSDLMQYIHETADKDPEVVCDIASYDAVESFTGNPRLGWYVSDQTTREQISTLLSHSLGATSFGATTGQWKAAQMRIPSQPDGDYLSVVGSFGESQAFPDEGDDLRDRVHAARNVHPLRESETAGVTTTWPEEQRQQVIDQWRITERADFDDLEGFPGDTAEPLSIASIDPNTGDEAGGTAVTLTGTGFDDFDTAEGHTWTIGGEPVTNITVVSGTEMTGETPAGSGSADVVVTIGGQSDTLVGGFTYEAAGVWTPLDVDLMLYLTDRDPSTITDPEGPVSEWLDKGPEENRGAQATSSLQPSMSSGFMDFLSSRYLTIDDPLPLLTDNQVDIFIVGSPVTTGRSTDWLAGLIRQFPGSDAAGSWTVGYDGNGRLAILRMGGQLVKTGTATITSGERVLIGYRYDGTQSSESDRWSFFANAEAVAVDTTGGASSGWGDGREIGRAWTQGAYNWRGEGNIIVVCPRLSAGDYDRMEGFLAWELGLEGDLPASHPYKSSPP